MQRQYRHSGKHLGLSNALRPGIGLRPSAGLRQDTRRYQQGVSMIEVLVALLLMGFAVLGFAALQMRALTATTSSYESSQAMSIAEDARMRMQANPAEFANYVANLQAWQNTATPASFATSCNTAVCTAAQLRTFDVSQLQFLAGTLLTQGEINVINRSAAGGVGTVQVIVAWGNTTPTIGTTTADCISANTSGQVLRAGAQCIASQFSVNN